MDGESVLQTAYAAWEQFSNRANCTEPKICRIEGVIMNFTKHARFLIMMPTPTEALDHYFALPSRDVINDAVVPFTMFLFLEYLLARIFQGKWRYAAEYIPNIYSGMLLQTFRLAFHVVEFWFYGQIYDYWHLPLADYVNWRSWIAWIVVVFLLDFGYYCFHRCGHEMAIFWTMHQVHHSSCFFNYSIGFRIPHLHDFAHSGFFYLPMALLGVPPDVTFLHKSLNLLYQFWIHCEFIPKLGPLEWFLNTASHHRVHHARQAKYLDKNYGSVFIIWDKMFGTFCEEDEADKPIYGLTKPQNSLNVFYYQHIGWVELWEKFRSMEGWSNKLQCLIKGPGWEPGSPWTGFPEKVPIPDRSDEPKLAELSWYWRAFLLIDLTAAMTYFSVLLLQSWFVSTNVFYVTIVLLYAHAWCVNLVLEGHSLAGVMQTLRLAIWRAFLQDHAWRIVAKNATPIERFLQMNADGLMFILLIASCIHLFVTYHKRGNILAKKHSE